MIGAYFIFFSFIPCLSFMFYVIVCFFFISLCVVFLSYGPCCPCSRKTLAQQWVYIITRFSVNSQKHAHFYNLRFPYFSFSRDFHPCNLVPRFPLSRFPLQRFQRPQISHFLASWGTVHGSQGRLSPLVGGSRSPLYFPYPSNFSFPLPLPFLISHLRLYSRSK